MPEPGVSPRADACGESPQEVLLYEVELGSGCAPGTHVKMKKTLFSLESC